MSASVQTAPGIEQLSQQYARNYGLKGNFGPSNAILARGIADADGGTLVIDGSNLAQSLTNLLASPGAAAAISTLTTGTDLTTSGVLTTLATNIGAHDTQGVTLMSALVATTGALTSRTLTTPVVASGVTASGSGANTFAGSSGTFVTSTGLNTFSGKAAFKVIATPVAAAGSNVGGAAALGSANIVTVSSDSAAKGVILPVLAAGDLIDILNTSSTALILYPSTGGTINGLSANAGVLIPASKGTRVVCTAALTLTAFDAAAHSTAA